MHAPMHARMHRDNGPRQLRARMRAAGRPGHVCARLAMHARMCRAAGAYAPARGAVQARYRQAWYRHMVSGIAGAQHGAYGRLAMARNGPRHITETAPATMAGAVCVPVR
jgi:hypothetical protein